MEPIINKYQDRIKITESERLILYKLTLDDSEFMIKLWNDPVVSQWIGNRNVTDIESARKYLIDGPLASYEKNGYGLYLNVLKETMEPIGMTGLVKRPMVESDDEVNIGFSLITGYRSKGYALESAKACIEYGQTVLGMTNIIGTTSVTNKSSKSVLEKLGLVFKGTFKLEGWHEDMIILGCAIFIFGNSWDMFRVLCSSPKLTLHPLRSKVTGQRDDNVKPDSPNEEDNVNSDSPKEDGKLDASFKYVTKGRGGKNNYNPESQSCSTNQFPTLSPTIPQSLLLKSTSSLVTSTHWLIIRTNPCPSYIQRQKARRSMSNIFTQSLSSPNGGNVVSINDSNAIRLVNRIDRVYVHPYLSTGN
eukprot:gene7666-9432_t